MDSVAAVYDGVSATCLTFLRLCSVTDGNIILTCCFNFNRESDERIGERAVAIVYGTESETSSVVVSFSTLTCLEGHIAEFVIICAGYEILNIDCAFVCCCKDYNRAYRDHHNRECECENLFHFDFLLF